MNVSELFNLTRWVETEIVATQIPQKYNELQAILQKYSQPNIQKQPFETQKDNLINTLEKVPLNKLTNDQLSFLQQLGISQAVGSEGIEMVEEVLYKNVIDVATSADKLKQILLKINSGIAKFKQIKAGLDGLVLEEEYETENEILVRVSFTGNTKISNVIDFKSWGNKWYEIGRGIAMAHNSAPEEVKIVGATKGSIIIELAVIAKIAGTTSAIILAALKVSEKVLDIRKKAEELRGLKLKNKKLANEIEKESENEKKTGIEEISDKIVKELKINKTTEGDKVNALNQAVMNLVNFIESGGEVDFVMPEEEVESNGNENKRPDYDSLRVTFEEIRQLEHKIKLLESKSK